MRTVRLAAALFLFLLLALSWVRTATARQPRGDDPLRSAATSLLYDMHKIVALRRSAGWTIDRYEYEKMMPDALMSVCRTTEETRSLALVEARREVARRGGPLEDALAENGGDIEELDDLLFATRVAHLLGEAIGRAPTECPPWVKPQRDFKALQAGVDRLILSVEGGGFAMIQYAPIHPDGTTGFRGARGGGGRVLLGRGFGHHWSLRVGPELDVHMLVRRAGNTADLPLQYQGAVPVVVRYTDVSWHYNLEVAPMVMLTNTDLVPRFGGRFGVLIGVSHLKTRRVIPWAGLALMVELFPAAGNQPMLLNLRGGLRVGFDWDWQLHRRPP